MYCLLACHQCKTDSKDSNHSLSQKHSSIHCMRTHLNLNFYRVATRSQRP